MAKKTIYVSASDVGDYVFCKRGWWLGFNGLKKETEEMKKGTNIHEQLAAHVASNQKFKKFALTLILVSLLALLLLILLILFK